MRHLLFVLLLALAACSPSEREDAIVLDDFHEQEYVLYPKADGKPCFHSHKGATYLSDLSIGRISITSHRLAQRIRFRNGITLRVFRDGVLYLQMKADRALSTHPFREVVFSGMTGFTMDSLEVEVESMLWKVGEPLVSTEGFVQFVTQDKIVEGRGMEARLDFQYYAIEKVTNVIDLAGEAP